MNDIDNRIKIKARIKAGSEIMHDHLFGQWPTCRPPISEYRDKKYQYQAKNPDMTFDAEWRESVNGGYWKCIASGYGKKENYGNGCIFVHGKESIEAVVCEMPAELVEKLKTALEKIATLNPSEDSKEGNNVWGEADCFNQAKAIAWKALIAQEALK